MLNVIRSELMRLRRPSVLAIWFGLTAVFAILIDTVMFSTASGGASLPAGGPGAAFPNAAALASPDGLVAGLSAASSLFGVITLSFWALGTATDYSSGLVRSLVAAQPTRWRLLAGKVVALMLLTAVATTVATIAVVMAAVPAAQAAGISTAAWTEHPLTTLVSAWVNAYAALLVWGVIGLVLATLSRSAAVGISVGVGYVLVLEPVVTMIAGDASQWLLGSTLSALAHGGTLTLAYGTALALAALYAVMGLGLAGAVFIRRDITD